jgi:hypothetical protein
MEIRKIKAGRNVLTNLFKGLIGAEIGVERGKFSARIMESEAEKLYCIDIWSSYGSYRKHVSTELYDEIYADAQNRLKNKNVEFIKAFSSDAVKQFKDESLSFIYLDSAHDYDSVARDLQEWWPKLKSGGIFSGHDYTDKRKDFGVIKAVNEFCIENNISELTIWGGDRSPSYSFYK